MIELTTTTLVLLGTAVLGLNAGVVGVFTVLRKRSLVGDAIAHAALPGVCVAYFFVHDRNFVAFLLGALVFGLLASATITFIRNATRIKGDTAIGITLGSYFGLGLVLSRIIQNEPSGNRAGIDSFIFGKAASMVRSDAVVMSGVAVLSLSLVLLLFKELKLLCFDRDYAQATGWPAAKLDLFLLALVCLCTVSGLPAVGIVMIVSLLTIPPTAAQFWSDRLEWRVALSGAFGLGAGVLGTFASAHLPNFTGGGWPTGPVITLVAAAFFLISLFFAPHKGVFATALRRRRFERRIALQNLLRAAFEVLEQRCALGARDGRWHISDLPRYRGSKRIPALHEAVRRGYVTKVSSELFFTKEGLAEAHRIVRTHRLWETYLIERADIAPDHVDRDADEIEHVLEPSLLRALETKLRELGRLPKEELLSPHELLSSPPSGGPRE